LSKPKAKVAKSNCPRLLHDSQQPADLNPRPRGRWSSALTTDHRATWSKTSSGAHGYGLHLLGVFSYRGWGHQRDSEVLRSVDRKFGTVTCDQLCETAVCSWERSKCG